MENRCGFINRNILPTILLWRIFSEETDRISASPDGGADVARVNLIGWK